MDNLAEKVEGCPLNWDCQVLQLGLQRLSAILSRGVHVHYSGVA